MFNKLLMASIIIVLSGCTNYKAIIQEKDQQLAQNQQAMEELNAKLIACEQNMDTIAQQCRLQIAEIETEDDKLLARERELRQRLAQDIAMKNVEIQKLQGKLSVKVMDKILFESGSVNILPEGQAVLKRIAQSLADADENLRIEGHTDNVTIGPVLAKRIPTNWELSVLRAASVVRFLEKNNIASERLSALGYSQYQPVADNDSEESKQLNRRVEIVLVPKN